MNDRYVRSYWLPFWLPSWLRGSVMSVAVLSAACNDAAGEVSVTSVYRAQQCGEAPAGLSRLENREALAAVVRATGVRGLNGGLDGEADDSVPSVDFDERLVLLLSEGQRPTAGFGIALQGNTAPVDSATAELPVRFTSPEEGSIVAQVVTNPCLVLALTPGDYERVVAGPYQLPL